MKTLELPPIATALGRLRQNRPAPRAWPFAPLASTPTPAPAPEPLNDFLITTLAPELLPVAGGLAPLPPLPIPGLEAAHSTYWFDL